MYSPLEDLIDVGDAMIQGQLDIDNSRRAWHRSYAEILDLVDEYLWIIARTKQQFIPSPGNTPVSKFVGEIERKRYTISSGSGGDDRAFTAVTDLKTETDKRHLRLLRDIRIFRCEHITLYALSKSHPANCRKNCHNAHDGDDLKQCEAAPPAQ